ncbi:MAG TPA: hypothetical protein VK897_15250 [Anaerolineales bacterium]|nr:hypothetical protein [Anaerolineales bacterium]
MSFKRSTSSRYITACLILFMLAACAPVQVETPQMVAEAATPTPEIFNPLDPSPTPSDSTLPLTCQVTDLSVYINEEWRYCFAYPTDFVMDESRAAEGVISFYGPGLEDTANPVRVSLEITTQLVPGASNLPRLVDAYLTSFHELSGTISREPALLGGEPAEQLEPVPGLLSSRLVMALHDNILFTLRFHPSDLEIAKSGLNDLSQTVTGSFAFLPLTAQPASRLQTVSWSEFGQNISLSYNPILAPWVEAVTVPAVPVSDQILFSESHPTYAQFRFLGFQGGRLYDLPLLPQENRVAQVSIFPTSEFPGFSGDNPQGFASQSQALKDMLQKGIEPARCAQPIVDEPGMPFLPWVNSKQSLCAQPKLLEFANGKGVRYLTYYSQGVNPVLEQEVFYTFQGITDDGQFYVSALFPVETGVFPAEPPPCPKCGEPDYNPFVEWEAKVTEQLTKLNAQPEDNFTPSLSVLDELIQSIQIE